MFLNNPFAELSAVISPSMMQGYVVLMFFMVVGGTILDMLHKQSAKYFFENAEKAKKNAKRTLSGGEKVSLAAATVANEVLTSSEFASTRRRISHLLTMYGFIIFVATTAWLIFAYPTPAQAAPKMLSAMWHIGAIMLCLGGYWFWFFIRVDVSSEGVKWYNFNGRGDIFIVGLISMGTLGLIWSFLQSSGSAAWVATVFFVLFLLASTTLFSTVLWSKFAHMFFKPAAAFQKRCIKADGSYENLPEVGDLTDPALQAKYPDIPEYMGDNPPNMGLGIKSEAPSHY